MIIFDVHERDGFRDPYVSTHKTESDAREAARALSDWQIFKRELDDTGDEIPVLIQFCQSVDGGSWHDA